MKAAVSIPDRVFVEAERLARLLRISRSELYARAIAAFVGTHAHDQMTEKMNATVGAVDASCDPFSHAAAWRAIGRVEW
jgi:hypothetical protein